MSENFPVSYEDRKNGKVATVTLNGIAPNNTLSLELLNEFVATMGKACEEADGVIVNSNNPKFFSNGLDGGTLLAADQTTRENTIAEMIRVYAKMLRFPKPWIAEIAGHAMAGGAVISSAADYRYMIATGARIGFSELAVGLSLPLVYIHNIHRLVQPACVRSIIEGNAYKADEALRIGLIDGVAESPEDVRKMCLKRMDGILRLEQAAYLPTRMRYRSAVLREIDRDEDMDVEGAMELTKTPAFEKALNMIAGKNR
ncbi:MAG: enoyl-CoA hydratase/isomerase family protein [Leptospirales bacterium]|jgi:enoyl-CoA hydratase